jgi:hypothetical protein
MWIARAESSKKVKKAGFSSFSSTFWLDIPLGGENQKVLPDPTP